MQSRPAIAPNDSDTVHCDAELRRLDYDRWLTTLFAPIRFRAALQTLYMFNVELSRIPDQVREPMLGRIRLQWWREAIDGMPSGSARSHPVVRQLHILITEFPVDRGDLRALIDAREADLALDEIVTVDDLVRYATDTAGRLTAAAARLLSATVAPAAGAAYGLVGMIRALPYHTAQGRVYLPRDLLGLEGMVAEEVAQGRKPEAVIRIVRQVAERARREMAGFRDPPPAALPALLPNALARVHLKALERAGYDPASPSATASLLRRQVAVLVASIRGRV